MQTRFDLGAVVAITIAFLSACRSSEPSIAFSLVPVADPGGPESLEAIRGSVSNRTAGDRLVLYSFSGGAWWVQPFTSHQFTDISGDLTWQNSIHLGERYAALLVDAAYKPPTKLSALPSKGAGVRAVATADGTTPRPATIHFSGYEWEARQISSNWGGKLNPYDPANAWTDENGFLHLRIAHRDNRWFCADVGLKESLGQGSYRFTVQDVSKMDPAAVLRMYTWDHFKRFNSEMSVDASRWGDPDSRNGQFLVQPSFEPHNLHRFEIPAGLTTFGFDWMPGKISFEAARGRTAEGQAIAAKQTFTSAVPQPGGARIHISFFPYGDSRIPMKESGEVIIEQFRYTP
jgi:hypothetical protein